MKGREKVVTTQRVKFSYSLSIRFCRQGEAGGRNWRSAARRKACSHVNLCGADSVCLSVHPQPVQSSPASTACVLIGSQSWLTMWHSDLVTKLKDVSLGCWLADGHCTNYLRTVFILDLVPSGFETALRRLSSHRLRVCATKLWSESRYWYLKVRVGAKTVLSGLALASTGMLGRFRRRASWKVIEFTLWTVVSISLSSFPSSETLLVRYMNTVLCFSSCPLMAIHCLSGMSLTDLTSVFPVMLFIP